MVQRFRQKACGTWGLALLLIFAVGPGLGLHVLGDAWHNARAHHHHAYDFAADFGINQQDSGDGEQSCALDHDHDRSHAANLTLACIAPPLAVAAVTFDETPITYPPEAQRAPPPGLATTIDKPPRLTASA